MEEYMLPCMNKKLFGIDCPGCGTQRAFNLLIHGEFVAAFKMFPAIYTLIMLLVFIALNMKFKFKHGQLIIGILAVTNLIIMVSAYVIKMNNLF